MASGTFPSLFEPMELEVKLLIDGGVLNNYPIEELKSLGANFIVGVDVQQDLSKRGSLGSATDILLQINNFRTVEAMKSKSNKTDLYIRPNMAPYSIIDFDKGAAIVAEGARAALLQENALLELSKNQLKKTPLDKTFQRRDSRADSLKINYIEVNGIVNYSDDYVKGKLRFKEGDQILFEDLKRGINNLAANIAKVTDDILRPGSFKRAPSYFGYGLGYGFESILGPAQLMYTKSPLNGLGAVFFTLGFPF